MSQLYRHLNFNSNATTTDGVTATTIASFDTATNSWGNFNNCAIGIVARVTGRNTATNASVHGVYTSIFNRSSGTLTTSLVSVTGNIIAISALNGATAMLVAVPSFAISGTAIQFQMTGISATSVEWMVNMDITIN